MKRNQDVTGSASAIHTADVQWEESDSTAVVELGAGDLDKIGGGLLIERSVPVMEMRKIQR